MLHYIRSNLRLPIFFVIVALIMIGVRLSSVFTDPTLLK